MAEHRILVADDDPALRSMMSWLLKEQGYEVAAVEGRDGLFAELERRPPDLVLLDIMLPEADGIELLEHIKRDPRWQDIPVLMLSALPPDEVAARTLRLGAVDYVSKPFRVRELLARIQAHLRVRSALLAARRTAQASESALARAREEAESRRKLVDILHEVTNELSPEEIFRILARRVARALNISRCSVILARPGDESGVVIAAFDNPGLHNFPVQLARYPEIRAALDEGVAVLIEDVSTSPLYEEVRRLWQLEGLHVLVRSAIALPFALDQTNLGVFFLRTMGDEPPLSADDVEFADTVIRAAVAAIQRAHLLEATRADKERLETLATTDPLTQLLNRRALLERLGAELDRAARYASYASLLLVDIDHFKDINDTHGHLAGDEVLRDLAQLLLGAARAVDVVARYGGEEFVILLPETPTDGALAFAERLRERVGSHEFAGRSLARPLRLTVSIGVATYPAPDVGSVEELFARADEALYRAKEEGRNRVRAGR